MCPFHCSSCNLLAASGRTVTTTSVDSLSGIACQYTATLFDRVERYCQDSGQTTFLGSFTNATGDVFYFEGGDICSDSGSVTWGGSATFNCGSESSVSVMKRVGVCQLALQFEDPQLCLTSVASKHTTAGERKSR